MESGYWEGFFVVVVALVVRLLAANCDSLGIFLLIIVITLN